MADRWLVIEEIRQSAQSPGNEKPDSEECTCSEVALCTDIYHQRGKRRALDIYLNEDLTSRESSLIKCDCTEPSREK